MSSAKITKKRLSSEIDEDNDPNNNRKVKHLKLDSNVKKIKTIDERTFHHIKTNGAYSIEDVDEDSDNGEEFAEIFQRCHQSELNEFVDVNDGEKQIMNLWNIFMGNQRCFAYKHMPAICRHFIDMHIDVILEKDLYRNFSLHLCNLNDMGIIY